MIREDKQYRDLFVAEHIFSRLPLKVRSLRKTREMTQQALADEAGVKKEWISQVENPNYGRFTLKTLLKIAAALDVALYVDFVPYSTVVNDALRLSMDSFHVPSAKADLGLLDRPQPVNVVSIEDAHVRISAQPIAGDIKALNATLHKGSKSAGLTQDTPNPLTSENNQAVSL
jgi:transcriptional regulator with XRE-family HTH domain